MPITTTADGKGWHGFDVYDLAASRNSGMTDQQIRDELMAGGFSASEPAGSHKRIGPDAYAALFNNIQPTPTPTPSPTPTPTPTPTPSFPDTSYQEWDYLYGKVEKPVTKGPSDQPTFQYTNFAAAPGGQMMNDFATSFIADNSAYTNPMYMPQAQINTSANQDPSIFEQVMRSNTKNLNVDPTTFQNIISNS